MDGIDRIGPRAAHWLRPELDPDREDIAERRRRDAERRRRRSGEGSDPSAEVGTPPEDEDPPHRVDVRA